ncbi:MAG TPA: hypothetical protein VHK88_10245, partial [Aquihabitans sp.]|nr:hypothetical protein [Aquihabitans sp.]
MPPTTCTRCAAPLPAVPADPHHPDWCAACAARAAGAVGPVPAVPPAGPTGAGTWGGGPPAATAPLHLPMVTRTRPLDALLVGLAAAVLAGLGWWAVRTISDVVIYPAVLVGLLVGQGVFIGARRGGVLPALVAAVLTLAALVVSQYFISRSLAVADGADSVPLWLGFSTAREVVQADVEADVKLPLLWLASAVIAAVGAGAT